MILYHVCYALMFLPHQNEYFFVLFTSSKFSIFSTKNTLEPNMFKCVVKMKFHQFDEMDNFSNFFSYQMHTIPFEEDITVNY